MRRYLFPRLWLVLTILLCTGTTAASTPTACTKAHCVFLPLVSSPQLVTVTNVGTPGTRFSVFAVTGEVYVTTSTPVYSATLEVRSYDSQDRLLDTTTGSPVFPATLPGQPNPFYFGIGVAKDQDLRRIDVRVNGFSRTYPRTILPVSINITSYQNNGGYINLGGTLTNEQAVPLEDIGGVPWTEDGGDQRHVRPFVSRLEPFETIPFSTSIGYVNFYPGTDVPYKIAAQGMVP